MKPTTLLLTGILIAVAAPGGYYIYKDVRQQQCLKNLSSGYGNRIKQLGRCSSLGASTQQLKLADSLHIKNRDRMIRENKARKTISYDDIPIAKGCTWISDIKPESLMADLIPVCDENGNPSGKNYKGVELEYK